MKEETINIILTLIALMPMTYFLVISIYGMIVILSRFNLDDIFLFITMLFGILGYVGLVMNLKQNKKIKAELLNLIFLVLGIAGFVFFISFEGGMKSWQWVVMMEEPDEWFMFVFPVLITIYLTVIKGKRLATLYKHNAGEISAN